MLEESASTGGGGANAGSGLLVDEALGDFDVTRARELAQMGPEIAIGNLQERSQGRKVDALSLRQGA